MCACVRAWVWQGEEGERGGCRVASVLLLTSSKKPVCGREKKESEEAVVFALALMGGTEKAAPKEGTFYY